MKNVTFIGDPHGRKKLEPYFDIVRRQTDFGNKTFSLGDNGFYEEYELGAEFLGKIDPHHENHVWLQGNHDLYPANEYPFVLGNHGIWNDIFYVRGAHSIDRSKRIEGVDWFREEELTTTQMNWALNDYSLHHPAIVATHCAPKWITKLMFDIDTNESTPKFLQALFEEHQPKFWIFGHHHRNQIFQKNGTTFVCLAELNTMMLTY